MEFVHLRMQSAYSLQDSTVRIEEAVKKAKEFGMTHLALTDHHNMYGAFRFQGACKKEGIAPIFGVNVIVDGFPLILLAETQDGYTNLVKLVTYANSKGKKKNLPQVTKEELSFFTKGLIALSGGVSGEIFQALLQNKRVKAFQIAEQYVSLFSKDNFFLEIAYHGLPEEHDLLFGQFHSFVEEIKQRFDLSYVATNDIHYLLKEHAYARSVFNQLQGDTPPFWEQYTQYSNEFYFTSPETMHRKFKLFQEALENTVRIAKRCEGVQIPTERRLPDFPVPNGHTVESYFEYQAWEGFKKRFPVPKPEYKERLKYEIDIIKKMGFPAYFLIVWDFIHYAKHVAHISVGPGRGSAAGSLVSYCLEITDRLDPIEHDLLFERFLNPERISMPDIDIDFADHRREEMVAYVQKKYGADRVAQIITFGTMGTKTVLRDIGRVLGLSFHETAELSKEIVDESLSEAKQLPFFQEKISSDDRIAKLFEIGEILEGLPRHTSVHAAGIVISRLPVQSYVPLKEEDGVMITQWDMSEIEQVGLLKMDFLGLKTLTVEDYTFQNILETTGRKLTVNDIPWRDQKTFDLLQKGATGRVFQLESEGMKKTLRNMKPTSFDDIVAVLALYRPGPMEFIPDYIKNKERGSFEVLHPIMKPILTSTQGILVYQEQIMQLAQQLCGYTLGQADVLRRAVGKKKKELIDQERNNFVPRAVANGIDEQVANEIYDLIVRFANYGFNKSHAAAYAVISYDTAYLKAHFPVEFMAANLTVAIGDSDKLSSILAECKRMDIPILPPSLMHSRDVFSVEKLSNGCLGIRFGLKGVRNVGVHLAKAIQDSPDFETLEDYLKHIPSHYYSKQSWENLIYAGACDHLGNRGTLLHHLSDLLDLAREHQEWEKQGQMSFFELGMIGATPLEYEADPPAMKLFKEEKRVLEIVLSGHPMDACEDIVLPFTTHSIAELDSTHDKEFVTIGGIFTNIKQIVTKKGRRMAFGTLEDQTSEMEVVLFPKTYEEVKENIKPFTPLLVKGKVEWDTKEQHPKLIVESIRTVLTGRQVLYIKVKHLGHAKTLKWHLSQENGITDVIFYDEQKRILEAQTFKVRLNKKTLELLGKEVYELYLH
ncbi:DNA polymerase III subunit alpha [Neobacillus sp. YIM B02564]|uniref:DNA polymerase III subunit alpha n=1 Tax=Neobacillus paridis TaxID=2803862 RepID=A0ABS1TPL2_9BACI|nr:DNA polymerase III subunit alpha [Neobacillus paridis]MBL4952166.1 DNA polymerase III subunit alpha [Neobacillus paridis]